MPAAAILPYFNLVCASLRSSAANAFTRAGRIIGCAVFRLGELCHIDPWEGLVRSVNVSCGGLGSSNKKRSACKIPGASH